jgi:outer membrane protein assembly factor BamB
MRRLSAALVVSAVVGSLTVLGGGARAAVSCAGATGGGDWPSYGQTVSNARLQGGEAVTNASNVSDVTPAWGFTSQSAGGLGSFYSTPVIAGGCLYATTNAGYIFAANADTGELVWSKWLGPSIFNFAPAVVNGVVYVNVSLPLVPYVTALDAVTGAELWTTYLYEQLLDGETTYLGIEASAVVFDGLVFVPLTGHDLADVSHPSVYILDASDGRRLKKTPVIPKDDWLMYSGGGSWTTAAVDTVNKYAYIGTANPYNKRYEHDYTDSIVKIDVDRSRVPTFGEVVGFYKGENDYDPELYNSPECKYLSEAILVGYSAFCGQKDIDFGASPHLFTASDGRLIVGDLQKNCTYHAVDAATMQRVWAATQLGQGGASGCASTSAVDDSTVYVNVNGGQLYAFDKDTGAQRWRNEYGDPGSHYQPVTVANGVVYTVGNNGHFYAFDASTGATLVNTPASAGGATCTATSGGGVSLARNTIYIGCDSTSAAVVGGIFAYKL